MDRIEPTMATSVTEVPTPSAPTSGLGSTFRALAQGTTIERRRRSLRGATPSGRRLPAAARTGSDDTDSGTWRLAL